MNSIFARLRIFCCGFALVALLNFGASNGHAQMINTSDDTNHTFNGSGPWNLTDFDGLKIGQTEQGGLSIMGGATVNNFTDNTGVSGIGYLGSTSTGEGTAHVSGAGSLWNNVRSLEVGHNGIGTLTMDNGGLVTGPGTNLGTLESGNGTVHVSSGAHLDNSTGSVVVGNRGEGTLNVNAGGLVSSASGRLGNFGTGLGTAVVQGSGAHWEATSGLHVGNVGIGNLTIRQGGLVTANSATSFIGNQAGSMGTVTVNGNTSNWMSDSSLVVGNAGTGVLNIDDGRVTSGSGTLGDTFGGSGTVNVSGDAAHWDNAGGELNVGYFGQGVLNISSGGLVTNADAQIGRQRNNDGTERSAGDALITGAGSHWNNNGTLFVGVFGDASMNVEAGGLVSSTTGVVGLNNGSSGIATVTGSGSHWDNSGDMFVGFFDSGNGELNIAADGRVTVGGTMTVNDPGAVNLSSGTLDVGTLDLASAGEFNMTGGRLVIDTFQGDLIQDGGVLAPGDSPGLTEILGNYHLGSLGQIEFEVGGLTRATDFDALDVSGLATLDGIIDIDLINQTSFTPSLGDQFDLFDGMIDAASTFTFNFDGANLGAGLVWDTSSFQADGIVRVSAVPEPSSILVACIASGTLLLRRRRRRELVVDRARTTLGL